ncbi:hypothetical protein [Caballeronia ptereochthonis]|uniref:Uncharacterized protein n=1 Tax=Caballeronia ptereochthonis TaxID=1777144 RepID=A0A157ZGZ7_9BURK|nr:hypothetical protein [Caballeronia ptereochthonis]SAK44197.1 hypothetical protein AWB83_00527 [Caballeronia ptereochthonis]
MTAEVEDQKHADDKGRWHKPRRPVSSQDVSVNVDAMGLFGLTFPEAYGALRMMSEWKDCS